MARLPFELLDEIFGFAVALGIISPHTATLVCSRWQNYQKLIFKSVKLDPFSPNIPDLAKRCHLAPYIEKLYVARRSDSNPADYHHDLPEPFTNFLCNAQNVMSLDFGDTSIQWENVSSESIGTFRAVFQRSWFRSLQVSAHKPLPFWMLLHGLSVASELAVHSIGPIIPIIPPTEPHKLLSSQCSLTRLVLFGNASVKPFSGFCMYQGNLAKILLRNVVDLSITYDQTYASPETPITPYAEMLLAFLAPRLEVLNLCVESSDMPPSHISYPALQNLQMLQNFSIHLSGCTIGYGDTLVSAKQYMISVFAGLPSSSLIRSLSLKVTDRRIAKPGAGGCEYKYQRLHDCIQQELSHPEKWPCLTSANILVNVHDGNFTKPFQKSKTLSMRANRLEIVSLFQVNVSSRSKPPQRG